MILIDEDHPDSKTTSPISPTASSERTPLLPGSTSAVALGSDRRERDRSSSPPPVYTPPALIPETKPRRRRWRWVLVLVVVVVLLSQVTRKSHDDGGGDGEVEGGGGQPIPSSPAPPPSRPAPSTPAKEKVDKGSKGRGWDTLLFLPPLLDSHGASPILCNPRLPSNASDPTTIRSVFTLPMADVDLFLNFGAVQRRGGGRDTKLNVAPTAQVSVVPWLEEEAGVDWEEGIVAVVVERDAKDGLEVCQMGGRGVQGVGVFSSSPSPSTTLKVTVYVAQSPFSDRVVKSLSVSGLDGSLEVGDLEPAAYGRVLEELNGPERSAGEDVSLWDSFEVKAKKATIKIKSLATRSLMLSSENSSVSLENVRVASALDVRTTGSGGSYFGNVSITEGATASVQTQVGPSTSFMSLIPSSTTQYWPLPPPSAQPTEDEDDESTSSPLDRFPTLRPVKMDYSTTHGNLTVSFLRHFHHIPLQAKITSKTGSLGVNLSPQYQGSLRLVSPISILTDLPENPPFPVRDPYQLNRKFRVVITNLKYLVTGRMGWGFLGKPDMAGSLVVETEKGAIGVARFGGRMEFHFE